jgi:hypothetical protein
MKKILLACAVTFVALSATAGASSAATMAESKYCMSNGADPICMTPETLAMRAKMMEMTKDKAMASRTKYCQDGKSDDPICDPKMMNDTTGY